jgi:O-antigen ligase
MSDRTGQNVVGLAKSGFVISLFFLSPLVTSAVPRLTWLFLPLIAVALIVPFLRRGHGWRQLIEPTTDGMALFLVAVYVLLGAIWAAAPSAALGKSALLLATALVTLAASRAMTFLNKPQLRRAALAFAAGAFIGALFVLCELLTQGAITRFVMNAVVWLKPGSAKHVAIYRGEVMKLQAAQFRQHAAMLISHLWPGLLVLSAIAGRTRRAVLIGLFVLAVAVPVLLSGRMSSQVALVGSLLIFPLACTWRRGVVHALTALWCLGFVLVLPAAFAAYKAELHMAPWLPNSARARIIIWEYTAERVLEHPWLGIGGDSTRALQKPRVSAEQPQGFIFPRATGSHAHNLFLQAWYELGVVGVMLVAFAGAVVVRRIPRLPFEAQPYAAAMFAAFASTVTFAWGMWQTWLICAIGLMLLYFLVAAHARRSAAEPASKMTQDSLKSLESA